MRRRGPDKYENTHMDTQAFAQAYGGGRADHQRQAAEEAYYRSHPNNNHLSNSHSSQISHVWQTLEQHKAFLKADPNFEKSIHDQINAIAESRLEHEAQLKELDERLAHYSSTLGFPLRKGGHTPQGPPMNRDIAAKRTKSGLLVFFRSRPLGFEADYRTFPFRVLRVWRPDLSYLGITAGMTIDGINGVRPSREAIESEEAPLTLHFANSPPSEKPNTASKALPITEKKSALGRSDAAGEDEKSEKPKEQTIMRTITTPDREEPPRDSEISAADTAVLHPKLNLEQFSTRELGKLYGRAYGRYLEYQVLPWSKEIDTEKERLKVLMGRVRVLLEKYSVVMEKEIQQDHSRKSEKSVTSSKSEKSGKIEEIDRERQQESEKRDVAKTDTSNPEAAKEDQNSELENAGSTAKLQADLTRLTESLEDLKTEINANNSTIHNASKMEESI